MRVTRLTAILVLPALALAAPGIARAQWKTQIEPGTVEVPRGDLFIQNLDAVWTANDTVLRTVSILVRDGVIRGVGTDLRAPSGVPVMDGSGMTAIPGIVDEHSHIAMRATNEGTAPVVPEVRVIDALDPEDFDIFRALSGGVTTAQVLHGSSNPIGGQSAIIKTRWGMDDAMMLLVEGAPQTVKFALGENVTRKNFQRPGPQRFPASRSGVEAVYVQAFTAARQYADEWGRYRENPRAFRVPPRRDLRLEALVDIMEGRIRVHAHSYRSDEIVMLMRVAERFGFKIDVFTHVLEGYKVADEMAAHGAGGSTFSDWWGYKLEAYDAIPYNAAIMREHGVLTTLNSDIPWLQSFMVYEFNKPVKYGGVSREEALRMLTRYPAEQLLIADRVGTIEVGKDGDVVLLSGDPFDVYSRVEKTVVDGIVYYDREREEETRGEPIRDLPPVQLVPEVAASAAPVRAMASSAPQAIRASLDFSAIQGDVTALVGATVHPVSGPDIPNGVVVMAAGRVTAVGPAGSVAIPDGAARIPLDGKHVYPGLIDPITQLGLVEIGQVAASRDDREVGDYNPHVRAVAAVHPYSETIGVTRANGITAVLTVPASGVIQGMGGVIQLAGDTPERMTLLDSAAIVVNFPSPEGEDWDDPELKGEALEELVGLFERAVLYAASPSSVPPAGVPFEVNLADQEEILLASLQPAVTGRLPVFFRAREERDIRTLFLFLDKFPDMRPVLVEADQAFRVADELAERNIPVIVGSALRPTIDRDDPVTAGWRNASILYQAGVQIAFGTNDAADVRNLPYHAAKAAAFGLPKEAALHAVTLGPAEILGVGAQMGSIEVGKRADLIVTDGDPLQIVTNVERSWIGGEEVSLESRHTRLWQAFRERH
jgi:imidazolonepropionase-like amidohydrolase